MERILNVYKPQGQTPLEIILKLKNDRPEYKNAKIAYAGRLDPMADGVLLLLTGEECKKRKEYEALSKTYEFMMILGIETDTYDTLGMAKHLHVEEAITQSQFEKVLHQWIGTFIQPYPPYSSARVNGKPLFYWARKGNIDEIAIPHKKVTVNSLTCLDMSTVSMSELIDRSIARINRVQGAFRQSEIVHSWHMLKDTHPRANLSVATCRVDCESGLYVRSLAHDIGLQLGCGACTFSITRTRVGAYSIETSLRLSTLK